MVAVGLSGGQLQPQWLWQWQWVVAREYMTMVGQQWLGVATTMARAAA